MKYRTIHTISLAGSITVAGLLTGCTSMKPLASTPPRPEIQLSDPVVIRRTLGGDTILPAGVYLPSLEDDDGYYYEAPAKIIRNDTAAWQLEGGLYLPKGAAEPTHYYVIGRNYITKRIRLPASNPLPIAQ